MKSFAYTLAVLLSLTAASRALPLQNALVPNDAKWLVHLDVDNLRESKIGTMVLNDMLAEPLAKLKREMKVDGQLILQKIHSLTAFGDDFQAGPKANGVALLSGDEELQKIVEGLLVAQLLQNTNGPIKKVQQTPYALYSLGDQIFVCPRLAGQVVLSKSRQQIEAIRDLLEAKARSGKGNKAFSGYAQVPNTFFFLAVAEGFNDNAPLPPQAKILKMAEGARIVLGEKAENLFLNLALKAKEPEIVQQIGQVLEGMKALVALGQSENKELLELVQSTKVTSNDKMVTVNIEYPLAKVMGRLDGVSHHLQKAIHGSHNKRHGQAESDQPERAEAPEKQQ